MYFRFRYIQQYNDHRCHHNQKKQTNKQTSHNKHQQQRLTTQKKINNNLFDNKCIPPWPIIIILV